MHWWQSAFTSSSRSHSDDDSVIVGDRASWYSLKPRFFSSRWSRNLSRSRKLRQVGKDDASSWRSPSYLEDSPSRSASVSPHPLPLPELHVLLRRDPKFTSSNSNGVPLPSPNSIHNQRGGFEEKERERGRGRQTAETFGEDAIDGFNGFKRLPCQETRRNLEHSETQSSRKSQQKQTAKARSSKSCYINVPISAPTSPYSSPVLSPPNSDTMAAYYMPPPSIFHVWSAPEMPPHSDGYLGLSLNHQMPYERTASSVDNSPLQSPKLGCSLHAPSPPRPASPLPTKIPPETTVARRESNTQATVHPLPLPPGAGIALQPTPITSVASTTDFPGAFVPPQPTPISVAAKPEFPGANIPAQPSPNSQVSSKPELKSIKTQWKKGKLIGRGTFGSVYVAYNRETGALCAMKEVEILLDDSKSSESMRQLQQEIKVLSKLKHPNIVQYYGSEIVGNKFYIYLEYVHPGSINKFINDHCGAITEPIVRNFTRHILCGLAYLHSTKTIHRDIKGANLLVDAYGVVKLADFGMAKHLNGSFANLSMKGSPYWLAPELLQSVMQKDASSDLALAVDIWSLGCTIIEMMNGKPPWSEYEGAAALFKVLKETPPIPEALSADGKDFLQCCFRRNPADRPTASKLLDHPFVNYLQQPDARAQSFKAIRLTDNVPFFSERPCYKFDRVPASLDAQIKKGKLARK